MNTQQWFVRKDGKQFGPFTTDQIKQLASSGKLKPEHELASDPDGKWTPAAKVKGLFPFKNEMVPVNNQSDGDLAAAALADQAKAVASSAMSLTNNLFGGAKTFMARTMERKKTIVPEVVVAVQPIPVASPQPIITTKFCPFCCESIAFAAMKCRYCNEFLDPALRITNELKAVAASIQPVMQNPAPIYINTPRWNSGIAALLSLLCPGLGQLYKGQPFNGILWFVVVVAGYVMFVVPGLVLHLLCVLGAMMGNPYR